MNLSNLHPTMAAVLQSVLDGPADAARLQREAYIRLLQQHDWAYQFSDDHSVWSRGKESARQIQLLRREIDADGVLYAQYAPKASS